MGTMGAPMSSTKPVANASDAFLQPDDGVAISFWIISIAMIASTFFFFAEATTVHSHWKTSLHCGALVTLVAGVHYMYMREYWVQVHRSPIVYRYVDWSITVPLQMIEFNLILKAAGKRVGAAMFWKLLIGTVLMLLFGYLGEVEALPKFVGFPLGLSGWFFILFEIFAGEADDAFDCLGWLVHLPNWLRAGMVHGGGERNLPQRHLQHRRLGQQNCVRPCMLVVRQTGQRSETHHVAVMQTAPFLHLF